MKFTETKNIPSALLNLLTDDRPPRADRIGVNALNDSPQIRQLRLRHWAEIESDPLDRIFILFGRLLHNKLESAANFNSLTEELLTIEVGGTTVVGVPDHYDETSGGTITDYKFPSVYAGKDKEIRKEWVAQLNVYRLLLEAAGFAVKKLKLCMVFRDWRNGESKRQDNYPPKIKQVNIPLWSKADAEKHVATRLALHLAAESLSDAELPHCTDEERWASPEVFAVMEKGKKRATKLHDSLTDAEQHATAIGGTVEHRPKEYKRCQDFCDVSQFCHQIGNGMTIEEKLESVGL